MDFDRAWSAALADVLPPVEGCSTCRAVRERREWLGALSETRGAWEAAFEGAPEQGGEVAAAALAPVAA